MKGIVLAGGSGTRLYPITKGVSKQLLPIYDKPMIYYPISALIKAGINEILIISTPHDLPSFKKLLGNGKQWGLNFSYAEQLKPNGLAEAFIIGKEFIGKDSVCLVLGDNIFYGEGFSDLLKNAKQNVTNNHRATVFGYYVKDPERYGVVEFKDNKAISLQEKPNNPKSNYAVVGIYFYPNSVIEIAENTQPSERGELEITTVNQVFLKNGQLDVELMGRGYAWLDTGTHESLSEAGEFVKALEKRQGLKIACIEENVLQEGFITKNEAMNLGVELYKTSYGKYIIDRVKKWKY
tara:strand:- start:201 stop:1082 length:882 start_codon:yes stop_codon:yes gene_type:complete